MLQSASRWRQLACWKGFRPPLYHVILQFSCPLHQQHCVFWPLILLLLPLLSLHASQPCYDHPCPQHCQHVIKTAVHRVWAARQGSEGSTHLQRFPPRALLLLCVLVLVLNGLGHPGQAGQLEDNKGQSDVGREEADRRNTSTWCAVGCVEGWACSSSRPPAAPTIHPPVSRWYQAFRIAAPVPRQHLLR